MPDWACPRCGSINLEGQAMCEGCGRETSGRAAPVREGSQRLHMPAERPCTLEQSKAANRILQDVLERRYSAAEGRRRLSELFTMPDLVALED